MSLPLKQDGPAVDEPSENNIKRLKVLVEAKRALDKLDRSGLEQLQAYVDQRKCDHPELAPRCMLLELPPELRNRIWDYTQSLLLTKVVKSRIETPSHRISAPSASWCDSPKQPAISCTCRALRAETLPIFYGANIWTSESLSFFRGVKQHISLFKKVEVPWEALDALDFEFDDDGKFVLADEEKPMEEKLQQFKALGFKEGVVQKAGHFECAVKDDGCYVRRAGLKECE